MPTLEEIAAEFEEEAMPQEAIPEAMPQEAMPQAPAPASSMEGPSVSGQLGGAVIRRLKNAAADAWNNIEAAGQMTNPNPAGRVALGEVGVNDAGQTTIGSTDQLFDPKKHVMLRDRNSGRAIAYNRTPGTDEDRVSAFARHLASSVAESPTAFRPLTQGRPPSTLGVKSPEMRQVYRNPQGKFRKPDHTDIADLTRPQETTNLAIGAGALGTAMMGDYRKK